MFESRDDLIAESHFREVAVIDARDLNIMATTAVSVWKLNTNMFRKLLTQLDNLHMI